MNLINNLSDWYKDAIIYQVHVRSFYDSNGDGIGDFKGLMDKLPYIEFLGVNTIWLLPFYPSPLKDEGYDIADYMTVNPIYGTLNDFKKFLKEAHKRNIRVITELVINHTSSQHEWFKKSRNAKPGSPWRNFYVWSDTPDKYSEARIIFRDFETSNWTWDSTADAYYWHRFYSHQPDLNYDNPNVQKEIFKIVDFWLGMGVDGLRLDAIPYLFQREGTNCENLPETHQFLKKLNAHIQNKFKNKFLLAEANQWPEDAVKYFGDGDECQMAFHFPLMPRMYMSVQMEDRFPIIDIMEQTPTLPEPCQWAIFLRNHDELTLEMVTDEERDFMYRMYTNDPKMRINLGIRRRLAPLMSGDRRKIELLNAFLFSMPGTPVIYYGDEIGMGDNFYLGDRNGVRTPMQWSNDSNAGFSEANPQKLYLPVIIDPEYNYQAVNVKLQEGNSQSLLCWMKKLIELRSAYTAFSRGSIEFLYPNNSKVIAFYRIHNEQKILVLINLSRHTQNFNLDLSQFVNHPLIEAFGKTEFPTITENPYFFILSPYGFLWLEIGEKSKVPESLNLKDRILNIKDKWSEILSGSNRKKLEGLLLDYIPTCRWYRSKSNLISKVKIMDEILFKNHKNPIYFLLLEIDYINKHSEDYFLFLTSEVGEDFTEKAICQLIDRKGQQTFLIDALYSTNASMHLFHFFRSNKTIQGTVGSIAVNTTRYKEILNKKEDVIIKPLDKEQSNTSLLYGDTALLKMYRLSEKGINPEVEINEFLLSNNKYISPKLAVTINYINKQNISTAGIIQEYIPNEGDGWNYSLNIISNICENFKSFDLFQNKKEVVFPWIKISDPLPKKILDSLDIYAHAVKIIAQKTAQMHLALMGNASNKAFEAENYTLFDQRSLYQSLRSVIVKTSKLVSAKSLSINGEMQKKLDFFFSNKNKLFNNLEYLLSKKLGGKKIRCHGDFHLGQTLYTGDDFIIIDYEGEPCRPLSERKIKYPPLKDLASMLRSFHYAIYTVLNENMLISSSFDPEIWYSWICNIFIQTYLDYPEVRSLLPSENEFFSLLLKAYMLEKVFYEINYEINNRPDWVHVPCMGLLNLMGDNPL
ncbi:Trehalose synthase/amylase TreS [Legionella wadsworthii]|uniref:maltose alpha-D-glucosyltransferase n=1 Tax=Legionella wadsworthii TaxID=28088 RepID=A0A378LRP7_9GAMM|nr:maltose alpha-D-glucosyltransferase [Legionella wadsworthii]STY29635.1 Trehalose synthase/amylase TreS [Legionella wadsworthii]